MEQPVHKKKTFSGSMINLSTAGRVTLPTVGQVTLPMVDALLQILGTMKMPFKRSLAYDRGLR